MLPGSSQLPSPVAEELNLAVDSKQITRLAAMGEQNNTSRRKEERVKGYSNLKYWSAEALHLYCNGSGGPAKREGERERETERDGAEEDAGNNSSILEDLN